ncbi:DNA sulfur modification protein DndD [Methylobacterium mesophilicum SR1.6/6]|uniref:DNA sulfur modification protein DndD n=1 Tax=Methylobacterium mesophilicum SR1.6/6 TaxID=908290 RepID=A0A6B9FPW5_9HYPH|nr:DNA sulfur modification protein DndD [Methylobacterium mesophilicum]QGY03254.1 DNA sulfur modification protein DndD [Methylobacterium mesophilicum SR1.6/6]
MYLKSIQLREWKAYALAKFDFPAPRAGKNIVLIGAQNGYGKTSLFEAVVLGLFGKDGMPLIARAGFKEIGEERQNTTYRAFLEKAVNNVAIRNGRATCSVTLTFGLDEEDEEIEIKRIWSFTDSGNFKPADEEVQIFEGSKRKPVGPGHNYSDDRGEWFRDYIAKKFLPYYLAAFFMFDGETVSSFAEREMGAQVRSGIQGLLGIPVLRDLAIDLRGYAKSRRQDTPAGSDATLGKLEAEREALNEQLSKAQARLDEIEPNLLSMTQERERITRELDSFGSGSQAEFQEQLSNLNRYNIEAEKAQDSLHALLGTDIALSLAGQQLRHELKDQLRREQVREEWEAGKAQGDKNLEKFVDLFGAAVGQVKPDLAPEQVDGVREAIGGCWEALWHPPPADAADTILHVHLTASDRRRTTQKLDEIDDLGASPILALLDTIADNESEAARIKDAITRLEGVAPQLDAKRERLRELLAEIDVANREIGSLRNEVTYITGQIENRNKVIASIGAALDQAQPALRRATRADRVAALIDEIVQAAVPSQIEDIATAMTEGYRTMAHKKDLVERVTIDEDCNVKLLNKRGDDVRDLDLSAGEKQIFTQSLISAVAEVSGRTFPMLIDTPLGRLDVDHRRGVLKHLTQREGQVILLSTNTEVVGEYYELVRPHVLRSMLIKHEDVEGAGKSTPVDGYFELGTR